MDNWEFPAELDEFLEFCVEEHGGDFAAISREFLEVASGLDQQLASRAEEAFSAQALQQRYLQLHEAAQTEVTEATEVTEEDWKEQALTEEAPSQFSVLTDSLQDRVRRIYNNVQLRLPSAYARDEEESERMSEGEKSEASEEGLREAAVRLFGSADLSNVVADLSTEAALPPTVNKDPSGLIARALRGEDPESSEDSAADDFRAMRRAVKDSSKQMVEDPKKPRLRLRAAAKPRAVKAKAKPKASGFVRLELVESASEEEVEEAAEESSEEEQDGHLRVLQRLESRAPDGDCPWDVWLQAMRAWPQLKARLNCPDFCRRGNDLRVSFDVRLLKKVMDEERRARAEARERRHELMENHEARVKEYIAEAERRRELMKGRLGYILAPRNEKLEVKEKEREREEARKQESAKEVKVKAKEKEKERQAQENIPKLRAKPKVQEEVRGEAQAEEAKALQAQKEKASLLALEVRRHRLPLWDEAISFGPDVSSTGTGEVFLLPWCERRTLTLILGQGLAESMLMLPATDVLPLTDAKLSGSIVAILARPGQMQRIMSGEASPLIPCPAGLQLFQRPLALWAHEEAADWKDWQLLEETICVPLSAQKLRESPEALEAVLEEVEQQGLSVVGLRLVCAEVPCTASVALRAASGSEVLLLALRGPHALALWRALLGPSDPALARQTDPASLNARHGGATRQEALALAPPSSAAKAMADVVWAFGGRARERGAPEKPLHALQVAAPKLYAFEISGSLNFASSGAVLGALLLRCGRVLDIQGVGSKLVVHALREGGAAFLRWPLAAPPGDLCRGVSRLEVETKEIAAQHVAELLQPPPATPDLVPEELDEAEPEVLIVAVRPQPGLANAQVLQASLEALALKFQEVEGLGGLGLSLQLLGLRCVDVSALPEPRGLAALRGFRGFAQVARHAVEDSHWWSGRGENGLVSLLCLRGECAISRFQSFLLREWKSTAATSGEILFSPNREVARQCYRAFFHLEQPTFQQPKDSSRFEESMQLSEAICFPRLVRPQLTLCVVVPPEDATLYRALTVLEQHGFSLHAVQASGPLEDDMARRLFRQEVEDGSLSDSDWAAFREAMGREEDEDFRCFFLVLSRQQAVKKLAQLCGHGDPEVNQRELRASLRHGRDRVQNGLRCATSLLAARELLQLLPVPAPGPRRLGLDAEAAEQGLQCVLLAASQGSSQIGPLQLLRDLHHAAAPSAKVVGLLFSEWERLPGLVLFLVLEGRKVNVELQHLKTQGVAIHMAKAKEAAAEVAQLFGSLPGARHYLVGP